MPTTARPIAWPRLLRQVHLWLGVFFAPTILFFAITGGLQEFKLHEAHGDYRPAPVIEKLSEVHIHQRFALKPQRKGPPKAEAVKNEAAKPPTAKPPEKPPSAGVTAARWFFAATAIGLVSSSLLGLWIGVVQSRRRGPALIALVAGALVPLILLAL